LAVCSVAFAMMAPSAKADMLNLECHFDNPVPGWWNYWIDLDKNTITAGYTTSQGVDLAGIGTYPVTITPQAYQWSVPCTQGTGGQGIINRLTGTVTIPSCYGPIAPAKCVKGTTSFPVAKPII
jgi:hypothetical protein